MTKEQFKARWEKDENGDGITMDEVADCAKGWGISARPKTQPMQAILFSVVKAAGVKDAEEYRPQEREE